MREEACDEAARDLRCDDVVGNTCRNKNTEGKQKERFLSLRILATVGLYLRDKPSLVA